MISADVNNNMLSNKMIYCSKHHNKENVVQNNLILEIYNNLIYLIKSQVYLQYIAYLDIRFYACK